jgi:hypothetical protein
VAVPDVLSLSGDEAAAAVEAEGLFASFAPSEPEDPGACTVEEQYPVAGDEVEDGAEVEMTVACEVPDVTGLDGHSAVDELEAAGFSWYVDSCIDTLAECVVTDQDPYGEAEPGAEVELYLEPDASVGPPPGDECDPAYPDTCIPPPPPDVNCPELGETDITVLPPDPHGLDGYDDDGIGCES